MPLHDAVTVSPCSGVLPVCKPACTVAQEESSAMTELQCDTPVGAAPQPMRCLCGSATCRGFIGGTAEQVATST